MGERVGERVTAAAVAAVGRGVVVTAAVAVLVVTVGRILIYFKLSRLVWRCYPSP